MKIFPALILAATAFAPAAAAVPPPPGTDIWVAPLDISETTLAAGAARNVTQRAGYDNQPHFVTPRSLLFTSMHDGQTDAWRLDLDGGGAPLLQTQESEYSPTLVPDDSISVVRVALDGVQQLWTLKPGAEQYELLFPMLEGIGYHAWLDQERVALFMVREPSELHIANRRSGEVMVLAKDIGRSLHAIPGTDGALAFVEAGQDGKPWIKRLDVDARKITSIAPVIEGSEDFAILPDGRFVMGSGRTLNTWDGERWIPFAEFPELPGTITRLAVNPGATQIAMVAGESE